MTFLLHTYHTCYDEYVISYNPYLIQAMKKKSCGLNFKMESSSMISYTNKDEQKLQVQTHGLPM